ncbi:MAG TPA: hypothetical protein VM431_12605 [Phycisphaerae bacterium]|nr:hypothetical protein [Phycisphaerae bacterium]
MTQIQPPLPPVPDPQRGMAPIQGQVVPSYAPAPPVNGLAVASLVLGIVVVVALVYAVIILMAVFGAAVAHAG